MRRNRQYFGTLVWCLYTAAVFGTTPYGFIEVLGDPADCSAVTGNGRLTVGVNQFGQIVALRWPDPGRANQVSHTPPTTAEARYGLLWGLRVGDSTVWLNGTSEIEYTQSVSREGPLIRTQSKLRDVPGVAVQEAFVSADHDVLAVRIRISSAAEGDIVWYADACPCATVVPELPFVDFLWRGGQDYLAFADPSRGIVYHFRPNDLMSEDLQEAHEWVQNPERPMPKAVGRDGVWMAYACEGGLQNLQVLEILAKDTGNPAGTLAAAGNCLSVAVPGISENERERIATVYVAFGNTRDAVEKQIAYALEEGYEALLQSTFETWKPVLTGAARQVASTAPELQEPIVHAFMILSIATSEDNGAVVRAPGSQPLLALVYPRHSIWASLALDFLGLTETSERHLRFLLSVIRTEDQPGMPAGSIPAAVYGDGTQGLPHVLLDVDAAGWLLWALQQHDTFLTGERHEAFLADTWPFVENLATFLLLRSDVGRGVPPYSFESRALRECATDDTIIACNVGLRGAVSLSRLVDKARPEWESRVEELEHALDSRAFSADGAWTVARPLSYWATGILDPGDPRWEPAVRAALETLDAAPPEAALRTLCDVAFLWRDQPGRLETLTPLLLPTINRARAVRPVDTLDAARAILAIAMVCGS